MIIAAAYYDGDICPNFGLAEGFKLYQVENGALQSSEMKQVEGTPMDQLPGLLAGWGVEKVLTGGVAQRAGADLAAAGIQVLAGAAGDADGQLKAYLEGRPLGDPCGDCALVDPATGNCSEPDHECH